MHDAQRLTACRSCVKTGRSPVPRHERKSEDTELELTHRNPHDGKVLLAAVLSVCEAMSLRFAVRCLFSCPACQESDKRIYRTNY